MYFPAYIDPGSGSLAIQAVIAAIVVIPFVLRTEIRKGVDRLRGRSSVADPPATTAPPDTAPPPDDEGPLPQP